MPNASVVSIDSGDFRAALLRRRDALVESHLDLARTIAAGIARGISARFGLDDLTQTAFLGLLKAATNYRPEVHNGTPFSAYARPVIRGAVLDSIRRGAWVENTRASITEMPRWAEPAAAAVDPVDAIDQGRRCERVKVEVGDLTRRQRAVIRRHYELGESLRRVGKRLRVSKSRASQVHCEAVRSLRVALAG